MAIERSKGKARPALPRSSDLAVPQPPLDPRQGRDANGRFSPGNRTARGRGWKRALGKLAGDELAPELRQLAGDAGSLYRARLAELPHQGPTVSSLVAEGARSSVLSARFAARAFELGLDTDAGRAALETSMRLGQRAERTSISAIDIASRLATADERRRPSGLTALRAEVEAGTSKRRRNGGSRAVSRPRQGRGPSDVIDAAGEPSDGATEGAE
jgi:hypothetical protein